MSQPNSSGVLTRKGRVVYHRKTHAFNLRDVARISKTLDPPTKIEEALYYVRIFSELAYHFSQGVQAFLGLGFGKTPLVAILHAVSLAVLDALADISRGDDAFMRKLSDLRDRITSL